jgi:hypothetical protein
MNNGYLRYYKPGVLITLVAALAISLFIAKENWGLSFSIVSLITGLLILINTCLWKTRLFSWLFWVDNFSGRYEGSLEYEYRDENCELKTGTLKHVKIIHQSGSEISIFSFTIKPDGTQSSLSKSLGVYIEKINGGDHFQLIYSYLNEGSPEQGFPPHYGTEIIKFINRPDGKVLSGKYYTGRIPFSTRGKFIDLKWVSKKEEHDF